VNTYAGAVGEAALGSQFATCRDTHLSRHRVKPRRLTPLGRRGFLFSANAPCAPR
jgi:hypothetical protein